MQHSVRTAIAAAVVATIGFGITAPAASAAPKSAHVKVVKDKPGKAHGQATATAAFIRNALRQAASIQARIDAHQVLVEGNADATAAVDEAAAAVAAAVEKANAITVDSTKADRKAVRGDLHTARVALETVAAALAADTEPEDAALTNTEPDVDPAV